MSIRLLMESSSRTDAHNSGCYEINADGSQNLYGLPGLPSSRSVKMEISLRMNGPKAILDIGMTTRNQDLTALESEDQDFANVLKASIATAVAGVLTKEKSQARSNSGERPVNEVLKELIKDFELYRRAGQKDCPLAVEQAINTIRSRMK